MQTISYNKTNRKVVKKSIRLYIPRLVSLNDISIALTGSRENAKVKVNVALLYTLLIKNLLGANQKDIMAWTQVSRKDLRTILGADYSKQVALLVTNNLLEVLLHNEDGVVRKDGNGYYWKNESGGECKKYRIPAHLYEDGRYYSIAELQLDKAVKNKVDQLNSGGNDYNEEYRNLVIANMNNVVIMDNEESRAVLAQLYATRKLLLTPADYIEMFNHLPIKPPAVCDFGHRAHHRVVRQNKVLRPYQRFSDDLASELVEIDFVASQPAILANITPKLVKLFAPECNDVIPIFTKYAGDSNYQQFQQLCFDGAIYEYLRDEFNSQYAGQVDPIDRDAAKKIFYVAAFSNYNANEASKYTPSYYQQQFRNLLMFDGTECEIEAVVETLFKKQAYDLFKNRFPAAWALFDEIKQLRWDFNPGQQHSNNCLLAQRIESGIIYTRMIKALCEAGIKRMTTTHDSINVKADNEPRARKIIEKEINKLGLKIKLKNK